MVSERKRDLRAELLRARGAQSADARAEHSRRVQERFLALDAFRDSSRVALYAPVRSEVGTELIFSTALSTGRQISFPRVDVELKRLEFVEIQRWAQLKPGAFGILEPAPDAEPAVEPASIELIAVPGVGFDARGHRLGYGGGYYDRLLTNPRSRPAWVVGLAFDLQVVAEIPSHDGDAPVDMVVTETRTLAHDSVRRSASAPSASGA